MANPSFPIDPPEPVQSPETPAPATAEVPHEEVHAALADALGVSADSVTAAEPVDPNDKPLDRPFTEILAERKRLDNLTLPRDPAVRPRMGDAFMTASALGSSNPNAEPQWSPKITYDEPGVIDASHPAVQAIFAQAAAEQEQATLPGIEGGAASPGSEQTKPFVPFSAFRARAELSQRIKRCLQSTDVGLPDVETEGLHIAAQLIAQIITSDPTRAGLLWAQLAKHCDDVAAALR